jgi:flavin reductase (DIM6/NTAB) family NADH-FMN oxidoreductase RutF
VATPIIAECHVHYECKIVVRKQLSADDFSAPTILKKYYEGGDHHMIVIGEILAAYTT